MSKKFDKEYSTQWVKERDYLLSYGIKPVFVKTVDGITVFKYTKTYKLFYHLFWFYLSIDTR